MELNQERAILLNAVFKFFGTEIVTPNAVFSLDTKSEELVKELEDLELMLCGGSILSVITGVKISDLDFYMQNRDNFEACINFFSKHFGEPVFSSANAITYQRKEGNRKFTVQLISRFRGEPEDIFSNFDFTITEAAYSFKDKDFKFGKRFFADVAKRKLVYLGDSRFPICALYRTKKYQAKGYTVPGSTLMHIALAIVQLEIKTYRDLKIQLMGVDTMYLQDLLVFDEKSDKINLPVDYGEFVKMAFDRLSKYTEGKDDTDD